MSRKHPDAIKQGLNSFKSKMTKDMKCTFHLTLYHTIPTFNDPKEEGTGKHWGGKGENAGNQHFLLFPSMFSALSRQ